MRKLIVSVVIGVVLAASMGCTGSSRNAPPKPSGKVYYVAPNGSDSNPGTEKLPWQTLGKAAREAQAGDTVYVRAGTYTGEENKLVPRNSGESNRWITFAAHPGETVILDGQGRFPQGPGAGFIEIWNVHHIKISGFRVINSGDHAILIGSDGHLHPANETKCHDIIIEKNYIANSKHQGVVTSNCKNILIDGNEITQVGANGEAIMIFETDGYEIRNNYIHDVYYSDEQGEWAFGIALYTSGCNAPGRPSDCPNALEDPIYSKNGKVHHNRIIRCGHGIYAGGHDVEIFANTIGNIGVPGRLDGHGIMVLVENDYETIERIKIYNNLIHDGVGYGVWLITLAGGSNRTRLTFLRDIHVVNNTIVRMRAPIGGWGGGILVEDGPKERVVIRNNIIASCRGPVEGWDNRHIPGNGIDNITIDHNLFFDISDEDPSRGPITKGRDYVEGDPLFVNPQGDFHLRSGSPAIDRGSAEGAPQVDYDGRRRPQGSGYDIGAFEY